MHTFGSVAMSSPTLTTAPIFIVGSARSGTTWVHDILDAHPQVHCIYESWLFTLKDGLGSLLSPQRWKKEKPSGFARSIDRETMIAHARRFSTALLTDGMSADQHHVVEKSPSHLYAAPLITEIFPDARFIHVVRDGRDVSVSVRAASRSWAPAWRKTFGRSVFHSGRAWKGAIRQGQKLGAELGERLIEVRYERLKLEPRGTSRRILDFCGIPYDDAILDAILEKTDFERNYKVREKGFRRSGRVGDWKMQFSLWDALLFNLTAGDMLIQCGYERNRWWLPNIRPRRKR